MVTAEPINIQIDPVHLRKQIKEVLDEEFIAFSTRLRIAADALDPGFLERQSKWIDSEIERNVNFRLKMSGENND